MSAALKRDSDSVMFWIMLAAQLAAPAPINPESIVSYHDFPAEALRRGISRFVAFRVTVRPDGSVQDCTIERPSGDPKLDVFSCALMLKRAKFEPAKWIDGTPAYGVFRSSFDWTVGGYPSEKKLERAVPADMDLSVNMLPPGAGTTAKVAVQIAVDEKGRVLGCEDRPPLPHELTKHFAELVPIACQRMVSEFTAVPAKDASGEPVRSAQDATILFIKDK